MVLRPEQSKTVDRAISAQGFTLARIDMQDEWLAGLNSDLFEFLPRKFVVAVFIGEHINHMRLIGRRLGECSKSC
jgi:hypothetical protein